MNEAQIEKYRSDDPLLLILEEVIFGMDYRLNALPTNDRGEMLFIPEEGNYYDIYLGWLADYLYGWDILPNERQKDLCRIISGLPPEDAMRLLGMYAGLYDFLLIDGDTGVAISERISDPAKYTEADIDWVLQESRRMKRASQECTQYPGRTTTVIVPREFQPRPRENIRQYLLEETERERFYNNSDYRFGDVGWRIPLSLVLRNIPNKQERIGLLDYFYDFFIEYASK